MKRAGRMVPPGVNRQFHLWLSILSLSFCAGAMGQTPEWIWSKSAAVAVNEVCFFRKEFSIGFSAQRAELTAVGDDEVTVYLNGTEIARSADWKKPVTVDVTEVVREGRNVLAVLGRNGNVPGAAAVLARLEARSPNNFGLFVVTDQSWVCSANESKGWEAVDFPASDWKAAASLGALGIAPWGNVFGAARSTPAESLSVPAGFKAELLKSADATEGSWICMTVDDRGRFMISPEKEEAPLLRVTLGADGQLAGTERLSIPMRAAMGLLYAHSSLYVNGRGPKGVGLYRLIDANHNDHFEPDEIHLLKNFDGDSEHGYHAVALGPGGMIYVMNGNHTKVPPGIESDSPYRNYAQDLLLPWQWDPNGHARGILAPGGYVLRTDPDGRKWTLLCGGFRNTYDFDFNPDGEMFTFDSDMEWDMGAPWYRPTRINHCVSGGEYGWRSGSGKWPVNYPDSLPGNLDIGLSSPTGVKFGTKSNFPPKYRKALFACDWAYGKIFAVHLQPRGASYSGTFETFVSGKPLNVTSLCFGPDGAMYFIIGGWKTQSGLYRISYIGPRQPEPRSTLAEDAAEKEAAKQRAIRHALENFHGRQDPRAIESAWPYLDSPDRWLRYAARVAIESQDAALWAQRALDENRVSASIAALLALARCGEKELQEPPLESLAPLAEADLTEEQSLGALRVLELSFVRMGAPDPRVAGKIARILSRFYPAPTENLNRELSRMLVYLEAPDVIEKTLSLMAAAPSQEEQMHYAFVLRNVKSGWTAGQRRLYFSWFNKALREFKGGNSFARYLVNIRTEAAATLSDSERLDLAAIIEDRTTAPELPTPPRPFVKEWTMSDLQPALAVTGHERSFARGKTAFNAAQCATCHRLGNEGGSIGPDLNGVAGRFNRHDLLENILLPSKIISDRYQTFTITKRDGEEISGSIAEENDQSLVLVLNPMTQQREAISKKEIQSRTVSKISQMPEGLLNTLSTEDILDLLAYLEADGRFESFED